MKVDTQTSAERTRLGELLEEFSVAMMTSVDAQGDLVSRPMAALELDDAGALWFFTHVHSAKTEQLGRINLTFSDKAGSTYVSLSGKGQINLDRERIDRLWTSMARPWFPQGAGSPDLALLRFVPHMAEYWDMPRSAMVRLFAMATSVVAGMPIGMGEHATLDHLTSPAHAAGVV